MKKTREKKLSTNKIAMLAAVVVIVAAGIWYATSRPAAIEGYRPQHCDSQGCITPVVFELLPEYPKDLKDVYELVYFSRISVPERFSTALPDESYYKQPEFYPTFEQQGVPYYTPLKPGYSTGYLGVLGYGSYPGDTVIQVEQGGGLVDAVTYWHASWGIVKYQGTALQAIFPETGDAGNIHVQQNPGTVKNYFDVKIDPEVFLLEPTFPVFRPEWAKKVKATISVNPNTPVGRYLIGIVPGDVPTDTDDLWVRQYKLGYMPVGSLGIMPGRPTWQIFIEVI